MDDAAVLHEVLVASRRAFVPMPDTRVIERPGWMQIVTPSLRVGGLNEVCLAVLSPDEADAVIDATIASYRAEGIRFRWTVGPDSAPDDLAARIEARGLRPETTWGVARPIDGAESAHPPGVTVEPVDEANVEAFTDVMARGWEMAPEPLLAFHRRILAEAPERVPMQLARFHGEPAGAAAAALLPRSVYLMGAVVLPEHRSRGLYRALVASRLAHAARHGRTLATSHARAATSYPILARLGFHDVCRLTVLSAPSDDEPHRD
jgi:GNAT superfamily N-acetyltransferase